MSVPVASYAERIWEKSFLTMRRPAGPGARSGNFGMNARIFILNGKIFPGFRMLGGAELWNGRCIKWYECGSEYLPDTYFMLKRDRWALSLQMGSQTVIQKSKGAGRVLAFLDGQTFIKNIRYNLISETGKPQF